MAKIAGIGRPVLLNSLENWAKTARDRGENENFAGLAAGETFVKFSCARVRALRAQIFVDFFRFVGVGSPNENRAKPRFCTNFGRVDVLSVNC